MKARLFVLCSLAPCLVAHAGETQAISCPAFLPETVQSPPARLDSVRVLSYPKNDPPADNGSSRAMPPTEEKEVGGFFYQSWRMGFDAPAYVFRVDCVYLGEERYLSFDANAVKHCIARWRLRRGVVQDGSLQFHCD